jgi:hypothetical protein
MRMRGPAMMTCLVAAQSIRVPQTRSAFVRMHNGKRFVVTIDEKLTAFLELSSWVRCLGIREIGLVFSRVVRSKLRQCGNLRENARENVGAQNFVLDIWDYLLAS